MWIVVDAAGLPPQELAPLPPRKRNAAHFLVQTIHGIRTVKSLALDARQRHLWDVLTARVAKLRFAEGMMGNLIQAVREAAGTVRRQRLLCRWRLSGAIDQ